MNWTVIKSRTTNRKIIGISVALLCATNGAFAQSSNGSSVELYGVLDTAVGTQEHSWGTNAMFPATVNPWGPTAAPNSATGLFNGGISPSRWGIRGTEDLGGGVKAFFTLESGFNLPSGNLSNCAGSMAANNGKAPTTDSANCSTNGGFFNRQSFIGLSDGALGSITAGLNYAPIFDIAVAYDPVQDALLFSPIGFSSTLGGGGGVAEDTRDSNTLKYTNVIGDFNLTALYKMGGVAGNSSAQSGYGFGLGYNANGFGVQAAYEAYTDAIRTQNPTAATAIGDLNVTNFNTAAFMIAAKYAFGDATVKMGYEDITLKPPSDTLASMNVTSIYSYNIASGGNFSGMNRTIDVMWVGGDYNLTPAFNLAVGVYDVKYKQSADYAGAGAGQAPGDIYSYSLLADYHFTKRTDVYFGTMYSQYKGALFTNPAQAPVLNAPLSSTINSSNLIYGVGLRTKF